MNKAVGNSGCRFGNQFIEESPQASSNPVASSTFMLSKTEFDFTDFDNTFPSPKPSSLSGLSTTSSLGVLDLEKESLLCDDGNLSVAHRLSRQFVLDQRAKSLSRFKERIHDFSASDTLTNDKLQNDAKRRESNTNGYPFTSLTNVGPTANDVDVCKDFSSLSPKISQQNGSSNVSNFVSYTDMSFDSGKQALIKIDADQQENKRQYGSLPISPMNISVNSENIEEQEKKFSEYVESKCYSLEDIGKVLRNKLILDPSERIPMESDIVSFKNPTLITKVVPLENVNFGESKFNSVLNLSTISELKSNTETENAVAKRKGFSETFHKPKFQFNNPACEDVQVAVADSTYFQDTLEESCASSIASIHQIAEALKRKSLMSEPKRAVEHLLSIGRCKSKYIPSVSPIVDTMNEVANCIIYPETIPISTPSTSRFSLENTPSTITCPAHDYEVDSGIGKVYGCNENPSAALANVHPLLHTANRKLSNMNFSVTKTTSRNCTRYFDFVKTSSLLEIIEDSGEKNDCENFWKLNPVGNEHNTVVGGRTHCSAVVLERPKTQQTRNLLKNKQVSDSFSMSSNFREPMRRISLNHNISNLQDSICVDSLDSDSIYAEIIQAGVLCVGTQVEVIIAIENPIKHTLRYKLTLKSILVDRDECLSGASVMLVSETPDINLFPNVENEVKMMLSPLIHGKIEVILEFISYEENFSNIIRRIKIIGERPKLKMLKPEGAFHSFGLLMEGSDSKMSSLKLKNDGLARLPLKLNIQENNGTVGISARTVIEPNANFDCDVRVCCPEVFNVSSDITNLSGQLTVSVDTSELMHENAVLQFLQLSVQIARLNLFVTNNIQIVLSGNSILKTANGIIKAKNTSVLPLEISLKKIGDHYSEFFVEQNSFHLLPCKEHLVKITFTPRSQDKHREMFVQFVVSGSRKTFSCQVIGLLEKDNLPSSSMSTPVAKPLNDVSFTPNSNSSSSSTTGADGPMELDCTHNAISWGSVALHSKNVQTITLRNRKIQKEKLLLSICDLNGTFKFVENEFHVRDLKLTLEPKESRKISISFMPFIADQAVSGKILIMRRHSLETSTRELRRREIPLYGIGGKVKIVYSRVFRDNESRLWITPDADTFEAKFTIENVGDSVGFVKFVSEDSDDSVIPGELVLVPKESAEVVYNLNLNKDRLDLLYKQNPLKEILLVNKLTVFSGCESTRLRLKKLWLKYEDFGNIQRIRDKIEMIMDMNSCGRVQVDILADSKSVLNKFWYEEIMEQSIGVLISQQHLELTCLESTVVFKDLAEQTNIS